MPVNIVVVDERGKPQSKLFTDDAKAIPQILDLTWGNAEFHTIKYIDLYGNTIFNRAQAIDVIRELERVSAQIKGADALAQVQQIIALAKQVATDVHLYLKFIGD